MGGGLKNAKSKMNKQNEQTKIKFKTKKKLVKSFFIGTTVLLLRARPGLSNCLLLSMKV